MSSRDEIRDPVLEGYIADSDYYRQTNQTPANVAALKWLHDAIYVNKIAPAAVTGCVEPFMMAPPIF